MHQRSVFVPALAGIASLLMIAPTFAEEKPRDVRADQDSKASLLNPLGPIEGIGHYETAELLLPIERPVEFHLSFEFNGELLDIAFHEFSMRSTNFSLLLDHGDGVLMPTPAEAPRTYRGTEAGGTIGQVTASLLDDGLHAIVNRMDQASIVIEPASTFGLDTEPGVHVVFDSNNATGVEGLCGNAIFDVPGPPPRDENDEEEQDPQGGVAGANTYLVEFAAECDYEFFQANNSSSNNTVNDVELIMNQTDLLYDNYTDITYELTTIVVRASSSDPYSSTSIDGRLNEFIANWNNSPETEIHRDVAQHFSGVNFSGGVIGLAPLGVLCISTYSYSIVESRYTNSVLYRTSLTAHEMGHNWNSGHCDGSSGCAIMCSSNGGCGTPNSFGSSAQSAIINYRNNVSCDMILADPLQIPFEETFPSSTISTTNWIHNNGSFSSTSAIDEPSPSRSINLDASSSNEYGNDELRSNFIELGGLSEAYLTYWIQHRGPEAGEELIVYYTNSSRDWIELERHVSDGTSQSSFTFVTHSLPLAARHNKFRVRFQANVNESNDDWFIDDIQVSDDPSSGLENDDCGSSTDFVLVEGLNDFTTIGATNSDINDPLSCSSSNGPDVDSDVWFTYESTCTGLLTIEACGLVDFDCRLSVYYVTDGCPTSGTQPIACSDDGCGDAPSVALPTIDGYTYHIRIGSSDGSEGNGQLNVICDPFGDPPVNDACDEAIALDEGSITVTTYLASADGPDAPLNCSTSNGPEVFSDIWFTYTPSCTGIATISTCDANFDTRLLVYLNSTCPNSSSVPFVCADDVCGLGASVEFTAIEGFEYLVRLGSPNDEEGDATILVECAGSGDPCPEDITGDGEIDGADLGVMLAQFGGPGSADFNNDGVVDGGDLGQLLAKWGPC